MRGAKGDPLPNDGCMALAKKSHLKRAWLGLAGIVIVVFILGIAYGNSEYPLGMLLSTSGIGGVIGFSISSLVAFKSKRPVVCVDLLRLACWTAVGWFVGMQQMAGSYYEHFWPHYAPLAQACSRAGIVLALLIIVLATVFCPPLPLPKPGACSKCGYDLTGNVSGICPECGQGI